MGSTHPSGQPSRRIRRCFRGCRPSKTPLPRFYKRRIQPKITPERFPATRSARSQKGARRWISRRSIGRREEPSSGFLPRAETATATATALRSSRTKRHARYILRILILHHLLPVGRIRDRNNVRLLIARRRTEARGGMRRRGRTNMVPGWILLLLLPSPTEVILVGREGNGGSGTVQGWERCGRVAIGAFGAQKRLAGVWSWLVAGWKGAAFVRRRWFGEVMGYRRGWTLRAHGQGLQTEFGDDEPPHRKRSSRNSKPR
mmetsp:Transcript_54558/g.80990  ORF Transcript_54558/g.80990 Transcript_54558/m.80990 type:complete len:260 (+) Transcript_54558:840-1619(+)